VTLEIPSHAETRFAPRSTRYALVIPVINEGERLTEQVRRMSAASIAQLTDIIIADGGSTDGSTREASLAAFGVRALLVKTGPGKLSAQLRMAYAFVLKEGYEGVITIDGNGKDSVSSIPLFVQALDDGIDYAQASRFVAGGGAVNTPKLRHVAIRLLHAPVLSFAAGQRFTDTTQGFRAYSRAYLEHPKVQPFRDIFQRYELLAYLTVRASQLGLRTKEIPTTRTYPADGSVPTKLTARGNLDLLRVLWKTATGQYAPRDEA
jgi:glycosyltransferase involved in cell wall biosynthesis